MKKNEFNLFGQFGTIEICNHLSGGANRTNSSRLIPSGSTNTPLPSTIDTNWEIRKKKEKEKGRKKYQFCHY